MGILGGTSGPPKITLGGHARHYKLTLGKEADQKTLSLPVSHPVECLCLLMTVGIVQ